MRARAHAEDQSTSIMQANGRLILHAWVKDARGAWRYSSAVESVDVDAADEAVGALVRQMWSLSARLPEADDDQPVQDQIYELAGVSSDRALVESTSRVNARMRPEGWIRLHPTVRDKHGWAFIPERQRTLPVDVSDPELGREVRAALAECE